MTDTTCDKCGLFCHETWECPACGDQVCYDCMQLDADECEECGDKVGETID